MNSVLLSLHSILSVVGSSVEREAHKLWLAFHTLVAATGLLVFGLVLLTTLPIFGRYLAWQFKEGQDPWAKIPLPSIRGIRILPIYVITAYLIFFHPVIVPIVILWVLKGFVIGILAAVIGMTAAMDHCDLKKSRRFFV
jgi:uncharacterized BrkB/YihY/UPF0761 family membrane protein